MAVLGHLHSTRVGQTASGKGHNTSWQSPQAHCTKPEGLARFHR